MCKPKTGGTTFTELVDLVSMIDPEMRVRFTSPHPKVLSNYSGLRLLLPASILISIIFPSIKSIEICSFLLILLLLGSNTKF